MLRTLEALNFWKINVLVKFFKKLVKISQIEEKYMYFQLSKLYTYAIRFTLP